MSVADFIAAVRNFAAESGITFAGAALLPRKILATGNATNYIVGIQLYSVRDDMKKDPRMVGTQNQNQQKSGVGPDGKPLGVAPPGGLGEFGSGPTPPPTKK